MGKSPHRFADNFKNLISSNGERVMVWGRAMPSRRLSAGALSGEITNEK
jgi:hypothetical protein